MCSFSVLFGYDYIILSEKEYLCLYGLPGGRWEVVRPIELIPPSLPDPVLGINYIRDQKPKEEWLSLVAAHSDTWLVTMAFFHGGNSGFDGADRYLAFKA